MRGNPEAGLDIGASATDRTRVIEVNEKPAAGQVLALEASSHEIIRILFGIDGATVKEADGNLHVYFHDGGVIVIKGATISQLCSNPVDPPASVDPDSVPNPESAQLVDLTGSGFRQLVPGPIGEASLTPTGALTDAELDKVWFRLAYEKTGATPDSQGDPDSHDTITGGAGADTINVSSGNDRLLYLSTGEVLDSIIGFDNNPAAAARTWSISMPCSTALG